MYLLSFQHYPLLAWVYHLYNGDSITYLKNIIMKIERMHEKCLTMLVYGKH